MEVQMYNKYINKKFKVWNFICICFLWKPLRTATSKSSKATLPLWYISGTSVTDKSGLIRRTILTHILRFKKTQIQSHVIFNTGRHYWCFSNDWLRNIWLSVIEYTDSLYVFNQRQIFYDYFYFFNKYRYYWKNIFF